MARNKNLFSHEQLEQILSAVGGLVEAQAKIVELGLRSELSKMLGASTYLFVLLFVGSIVLFGINIAVAMAIGQWLGNPLYGVLAVTAFYAIIVAILLSNQKEWQRRIADQIEVRLEQMNLQKVIGAEPAPHVAKEEITSVKPKTEEYEQGLRESEATPDEGARSIPRSTQE